MKSFGGVGGGRMLWVPVVEIEWLGIGGRRGFMEGEGLAVGEEAAADGGAMLGGFTVAVEEVEFMFFGFGFRVWELGAEGEGEEAFLCFVFSSSIDFFHHNSSASNFS